MLYRLALPGLANLSILDLDALRLVGPEDERCVKGRYCIFVVRQYAHCITMSAAGAVAHMTGKESLCALLVSLWLHRYHYTVSNLAAVVDWAMIDLDHDVFGIEITEINPGLDSHVVADLDTIAGALFYSPDAQTGPFLFEVLLPVSHLFGFSSTTSQKLTIALQ